MLLETTDNTDVKYDFLLTEICDKITNCINLLQKDNLIEQNLTLREAYEKYLHPEKIDLTDSKIWTALSSGKIIDVFQFNSDVGLQAAKSIKPNNPTEMMMANSLMRLMAEKGQERPLDRYVRLKNNINLWYEEVNNFGLNQNEISTLEQYYLPRNGVPAMQEDLMMICMNKDIANFTLKEANDARKIVAKKLMSRIPELKEKFLSQCPNSRLGEYVWKTTMEPQMGYSFSTLHSLAYSFVGIQTLVLATSFPIIYWNCACLITNSGGNEDADDENDSTESEIAAVRTEDVDEIEEDANEDYEEAEEKKKKKQRNTNYGKISTAIGQMKALGIEVSPPDINKSSFTFVPDSENNRIIYGIKGITRIGADIIEEIMANRPFTSLQDFLSKVKVNKPQMVNLIKSGSFDCFGKREDVMYEYIDLISDKKQRLTLQNMAMLIKYNLLPKELSFEIKVYNFNKYIKKFKANEFNAYILDEIADKFFCENYDEDLAWYEEVSCGRPIKIISQSQWDSIYKKEMDPVRDYLKTHKEELLNKLNKEIFLENWNKYCKGNISQWEMDSIGFYYHKHELNDINEELYNICNFEKLPTEPEIDRVISLKGKEIPMYKLHCLAGTVIDKNKNKNSISLLTKYGVVNVKIYQTQYAKFDKQISEKNADGTKTVKEKSWFTRGTKLLLTGIRRDDTFQLKKYKNTPGEVIQLITEIDEENKTIVLQSKRYGE